MDDVKIGCTKWYVDVEYKGNIARFGGEMCVSGFYAEVRDLTWIKRSNETTEDDLRELIEAVMQANKKNYYKVIFCNDDGSEYML